MPQDSKAPSKAPTMSITPRSPSAQPEDLALTQSDSLVGSFGASLGDSMGGLGGAESTAHIGGSAGAAYASINRSDSLSQQLLSRNFVTALDLAAALAKAKAMVPRGNAIKILIENGALKYEDYEILRAEEKQRQSQSMCIPGYEIMGFLGAGAMGGVFKARQQSLDRVVAIKVLPHRNMKNEEAVRRFDVECKIAAKLNHPHIVQAYDNCVAELQHYFVMEYIDGPTVHDVIIRQGAYSEEDALHVAICIADALAHAHQMDLVHRDVKPKNIMLTSAGVPKLADMGLAVTSLGPSEDEQGIVYGTPAYLAPEQAMANSMIDGRTDLYSLGATLFHMVTGRVPFLADNSVDMINKHINEEVESPHRLNRLLSAGLSDIIEVCMAKNPASRYASAMDLLEDLRCVQRGDPPVIARRGFTVEALSATKKNESAIKKEAFEPAKAAADPVAPDQTPCSRPFYAKSVFWWAAAGWVAAFIMTIVAVRR